MKVTICHNCGALYQGYASDECHNCGEPAMRQMEVQPVIVGRLRSLEEKVEALGKELDSTHAALCHAEEALGLDPSCEEARRIRRALMEEQEEAEAEALEGLEWDAPGAIAPVDVPESELRAWRQERWPGAWWNPARCIHRGGSNG